MARLAAMTVDDLVDVAARLRSAAAGASCMEHAAKALIDRLRQELADEHDQPACALVRFYVTARFGDLDPAVQLIARTGIPAELASLLSGEIRCITLLASAGVEPPWNDRRSSLSHQAIPLLSEELVERLPMVAGLFRGLNIEAGSVVRPDPSQTAARSARHYDVFFVADARSSPLIPDKQFVERYGIRSALGVGGVLPSGELFAVLLFSTVEVSKTTADLLRSLAPTVKAVAVPHTYRLLATEPS